MRLIKKFNTEKINRGLLYINLFFLQSYLIRFSITIPIQYPTNLQEILLIFQIIFFTAWIIQKKEFTKTLKNIKTRKIMTALVTMTLVSILLMSANIIKIESEIELLRYVKFLFFAVIFIIILFETFKTEEQIKKIINTLGLGALTFGVFCLIYNLLGFNVAHDLRLQGPLDSAVYLAYYLAPFFIWFAIKFLSAPANKKNLIFAITLGSLILATRSMGAIGGSFLILTIYILLKNNEIIFKTTARKIIFATILTVLTIIIFQAKIMPAIKTEYASLNERGEIWQTSFHLLKSPNNFIFGVGYGQFEQNYKKTVDNILGKKPLDYEIIQPHNIFLLFTFHYGIMGLIFILLCIVITIKNIIKNKNRPNIESMPLTINLIMLYFFIHGLIDTPIFKNDMLFLFILFMELNFMQSKTIKNNKEA